MLAQAKAFIALWHKEPHTSLMYAENSLNKYKEKIDNELFVDYSLFSGILWYSVVLLVPVQYKNARFHIFASVGLKYISDLYLIPNIINESQEAILEKIRANSILLKDKIPSFSFNINSEISKVCKAIDNLDDMFPKLSSGKIHYRKFYPAITLEAIFAEYIKIIL